MNARLAPLSAALAAAALALAGCNGSTAQPNPCATIPGSGTQPVLPELIYPMPGSTGVPDGNFTAVVAYARGTVTIGTTTLAATAAPSPVPSPYTTPLPNAAVLTGFPVGSLSAQTTYSIVDAVGTSQCPDNVTLGSFTTQ